MVDHRAEGITTQALVMAIVISIILLFLGIGVLVLIHICIVGRTLRSSLNEADATDNNVTERGSLGSTSMSRDDIEKLPCFDFKAREPPQMGASPPPNCAICLENFAAGEKCRLLPTCNHSFHAECVDMWLLRASLCSICRADADTTRSGSLSCAGESSRFMSEVGIELRDESGHDVIENSDGNYEIVEAATGEVQQGLGDDIKAEDQGLSHVVDSGFSKRQELESVSLNEVAIDIEEDQEMESESSLKEVIIVDSVAKKWNNNNSLRIDYLSHDWTINSNRYPFSNYFMNEVFVFFISS